MEITKETLLKMLDEIREYIETNSNSDGTFNFDKERAWVALDFVKKEIKAKKGITLFKAIDEITFM